MKWVWVVSPNEVGPSKDALFLESKSGEEVVDWVATEESKALLAGSEKLEGAIWVQTTLQGQLMTQEWLAGKLERVAIACDGHRGAVEALLAALMSMGWGFGARLGVGLDN